MGLGTKCRNKTSNHKTSNPKSQHFPRNFRVHLILFFRRFGTRRCWVPRFVFRRFDIQPIEGVRTKGFKWQKPSFEKIGFEVYWQFFIPYKWYGRKKNKPIFYELWYFFYLTEKSPENTIQKFGNSRIFQYTHLKIDQNDTETLLHLRFQVFISFSNAC